MILYHHTPITAEAPPIVAKPRASVEQLLPTDRLREHLTFQPQVIGGVKVIR